jgi:drug/metabolite transporter (DMT)-like permease
MASVLFACMGAAIKVISQTLPNEMIVFFRNLFGLAFILPWFIGKQSRTGLKTGYFRFHLLRTAAGMSAMYCYYYSLSKLPLSEAALLGFTSPLFIPFIAHIWLKELIPLRVAGAVLLGFFGVILILKPGTAVFQPVALVGVCAGCFSALATVTIRRMSVTEPASRIVFYFALIATIVSAVPLTWAWHPAPPARFLPVVMLGIFATTGQFLVTVGYSLAPAAQVGPFMYGVVVFSTLLGWLLWREAFDAVSWIGAILICVAGIIATSKTYTRPRPDKRH